MTGAPAPGSGGDHPGLSYAFRMGPECHSPIETTSTRLLEGEKKRFCLELQPQWRGAVFIVEFLPWAGASLFERKLFFPANWKLQTRPHARMGASFDTSTDRTRKPRR